MLYFLYLSLFVYVKFVATNKCEDQSAIRPECGINEVVVKCRTICPPQNCDIAYTSYACEQYNNTCERGCDCIPNYLRNGSGICIPNNECPYPIFPTCGINEIARDCRKICPPQTCQSRLALYKCSGNITCEPGCDCVPNYLRNKDGVCIPAEQCDEKPNCAIPDECIRTCASPNPAYCPYSPAKCNIDGCECMDGYILSKKGGKCIKIEECLVGCNGDSHARARQRPAPCPSTCKSPDATFCENPSEPIGCECEDSYILSSETGKCILPENCPGGNPCPENSEFHAYKYNCPQNYCPVDDNTDRIVCDPSPYRLSGCVCKLNYRHLSYNDTRCIVASNCPPVDCTRPNEVWNGCPSECFSGNCGERAFHNVTCNTFALNCQPKCVCQSDTFRNSSGICVPAGECDD